MADDDAPPGESAGDYPLSLRAAAAAGLFLVGALAFILIDIASNGKLTKTAGCGCDDDGVTLDAGDA